MKFIVTINCACGRSFNLDQVKVYSDRYPYYCFCPNCNNKFFIKYHFYALTKST